MPLPGVTQGGLLRPGRPQGKDSPQAGSRQVYRTVPGVYGQELTVGCTRAGKVAGELKKSQHRHQGSVGYT